MLPWRSHSSSPPNSRGGGVYSPKDRGQQPNSKARAKLSIRAWNPRSIKSYVPILAAFAAVAGLAQVSWVSPVSPAKTEKKTMGERIEKSFRQLDKNRDGVIDLNEFGTNHERRFGRIDKRGDGKIDPLEMRIWLAKKEWQQNYPGKGLRRGRGKSVLKIWGRI